MLTETIASYINYIVKARSRVGIMTITIRPIIIVLFQFIVNITIGTLIYIQHKNNLLFISK